MGVKYTTRYLHKELPMDRQFFFIFSLKSGGVQNYAHLMVKYFNGILNIHKINFFSILEQILLPDNFSVFTQHACCTFRLDYRTGFRLFSSIKIVILFSKSKHYTFTKRNVEAKDCASDQCTLFSSECKHSGRFPQRTSINSAAPVRRPCQDKLPPTS